MRHNKWYIILICALALLVTAAPGKTYAGEPPALKITSPTELQTVNVNDDWLYIVVEVKPGFEIDNYLLEMERLEEVSGEIIDDAGKTHMWQPTGSTVIPSLLPLPILIETSSLIEGKHGSYRVRVRGVKSGYEGGYTQWRRFCIGQNENCQRTLEKANAVKKQITKLEKSGGFVPKRNKKTMQTKQGESSLGPEGKKAQKVQGAKSTVKGGKMVPRSGETKLFDGSGPLQQDPGGAPVLKIVSPTNFQTVSVKADGNFLISPKTNPGFVSPNSFGMHFERLEEIPKGKEGQTPDKGATHWWETTFAANWGWPFEGMSMLVNENMVGGPGFYRVRIRALRFLQKAYHDFGGWTPWRYFCIGPNENCQMTLEKTNVVKKKIAKLEKGGGFVPQNKKTMQTKSGKTPYKIGKTAKRNDQRKPSATPAITRKKHASSTIKTLKPNIIVEKVHFIPTLKSGQKTHIYIYFTNTGSVKSSEGTEFEVKCKSAPKCFLADKEVAFNKDILPGEKYIWIFETETFTAGFYKMEVITPSNSIKGGNKRLIELNIPGMVFKKQDPVNFKDKSKKKAKPIPAGPGPKKDLKKTPSRTLGN